MSNKDLNIIKANGDRYPFKVSDEYFDGLTARIMNQIPEDEISVEAPQKENTAKVIDINANKSSKWIKIVSIAACVALVAVISFKFLPKSSITSDAEKEYTAEYTDEDYFEDLMNYSMVDHGDVYCYLSGEGY
ncbi:MAG: hypothetical protein MJZ41_01190 [Bacteroidaceae bacterium]|nr:hypothetical protein [Bacteroidaceae bacterium]